MMAFYVYPFTQACFPQKHLHEEMAYHKNLDMVSRNHTGKKVDGRDGL